MTGDSKRLRRGAAGEKTVRGVIALALAAGWPAVDTAAGTFDVRHDEAIDGDLSTSGATPTALPFEVGSNIVVGSVASGSVGDTRDFLTFTIGPGQELDAIRLLEYDDPAVPGPADGNRGFYALVDGPTATNPGLGFANLGGNHLDPAPVGTDLLGALVAGGISGGAGFSTIAQGTYTFVVQQTGPQVSDYRLDFVVVPEPASAVSVLGLGALALRRRRA